MAVPFVSPTKDTHARTHTRARERERERERKRRKALNMYYCFQLLKSFASGP